MGKIKGQNLRLFLGNKVFAGARTCTVHVSVELEELSYKDIVDGWVEQNPVGLQWEASSDCFVFVGADYGVNTKEVMRMVGKTVSLVFALADGEYNAHRGEFMLNGKAIISDIQVTAENRRTSTYTVQLTGKEDLHFTGQNLTDSEGRGLITYDDLRLNVSK